MPSYSTEIIAALLLILPLVFSFIRKFLVEVLCLRAIDFIKHHWKAVRRKLFKSEQLDKIVSVGKIINDILLELRLKVNAERIWVFLFHNGQYFNIKINNNSVWKFSCAYENCRNGVTYESNQMQNFMVSNYSEFLTSLCGIMGEGFYRHDCINCGHKAHCEESKKIIVVGDVENMAPTACRYLFEQKGIKKIVFSPLLIDNEHVGILALTFSSNFAFGSQIVHNEGEIGKRLCEYADRISFYLSDKSK